MKTSTTWFIIAAAAAGIYLAHKGETAAAWAVASMTLTATTLAITAQIIRRKG